MATNSEFPEVACLSISSGVNQRARSVNSRFCRACTASPLMRSVPKPIVTVPRSLKKCPLGRINSRTGHEIPVDCPFEA